MANLGAKTLGLNRVTKMSVRVAHPSFLNDTYKALCKVPANGIITGVVKISGVETVGVKLRLYARENGILLDEIKSVTNGVYKFVGLDPTLPGGYMVMALDPNSISPHWYTLVHDHQTAVLESPVSALPGLKRWFDASDASTIILTAEKVSQWNDKSSSAAHAVQADSARQLTVTPNSFNGLTALTGVGAGMAFTSITLPAAGSYSFVVASISPTHSMLLDNGGSNHVLWGNGNTLYSQPDTVERSLTATGANNGGAHIFGRTSSNIVAQSLMLFDGVRAEKPVFDGAVSGFGTYGGGSLPLNGKIAEIITGDQPLSLSQIASVLSYLQAKWGTPV